MKADAPLTLQKISCLAQLSNADHCFLSENAATTKVAKVARTGATDNRVAGLIIVSVSLEIFVPLILISSSSTHTSTSAGHTTFVRAATKSKSWISSLLSLIKTLDGISKSMSANFLSSMPSPFKASSKVGQPSSKSFIDVKGSSKVCFPGGVRDVGASVGSGVGSVVGLVVGSDVGDVVGLAVG